ncbi:hypothetical protein CYJ73_18775 [Gordonia terrae]|uniref:Uncharacterized protein n=1 Tax=Gordonia terrae TaxID=2055 RepID=A0A2I1R4C2_9ACTN|nr:DUF6389 family protein [Gordonia terrae]PKZ63980.1 hypothetical protein CYJ73_18775 [Gordonia terrae]
MDAAEYRRSLAHILAARSAVVAATLERLGGAASDVAGVKVDGVTIDVFVDQDAEGPFDVWARFEGADAFELDRRFDDERRLFGVEWGELGWEPAVPSRPRGWSRHDLEETIVDVVATWLDTLISSGPLAWEIGSGTGTLDPRPVGPSVDGNGIGSTV